MKKLLFTASLICSLGLVHAQEKIEVKKGNESYNEVGNHESIIMSIPYTNMDDANKALKKELKDWKGKVDEKDNQFFMDDGELKEMGENTFDAYAKLYKDVEEKIYVAIAINLGGAYMTEAEHPDKYRTIKKKLYEFCQNTAREGLSNQIKEAEDVLKDQEKELKDLQKDKEDHEEDIAEKKEEIKELEAEVDKNVENQEAQKKKISNQKNMINELNNLKTNFK